MFRPGLASNSSLSERPMVSSPVSFRDRPIPACHKWSPANCRPPRTARQYCMHLKLSRVVIAALALGVLGLAAAQNRKETAESQVLALESKWNDAYKRDDVC